MVGEIRDEETARVAVQAALTGHPVLATLHTNDAPGAVARLLDMNIEPYLLSSALNGAVAQRLARSICTACATKYYPTDQELRDADLADKANRAFRKGAGCQQCHDSGFQGRFGIYEVMEVTPEIRRMVHKAAPTHELRQKFREQGGRTLREEGVLAAIEGQSSLDEVLRVTHNEDCDDDKNARSDAKTAKAAATAVPTAAPAPKAAEPAAPAPAKTPAAKTPAAKTPPTKGAAT